MNQAIIAFILISCLSMQATFGNDASWNYNFAALMRKKSPKIIDVSGIDEFKAEAYSIVNDMKTFANNVEISLRHVHFWQAVWNATTIANNAVNSIQRKEKYEKIPSCKESGKALIDSAYFASLADITFCIDNKLEIIKRETLTPFFKFAETTHEQLIDKCALKDKHCTDSFLVNLKKYVQTLTSKADNVISEYFSHLPAVEMEIKACTQNILYKLQPAITIGYRTTTMC